MPKAACLRPQKPDLNFYSNFAQSCSFVIWILDYMIMNAFHAYDIRGIWDKDFNKNAVFAIGFFLPTLLKTDKILVGRDVRLSSPEIHAALTAGIVAAGAEVYDIGLATTPMVYYAGAKHEFKASVQITASHNPAEYNGLKVSEENARPVGYANGLGDLEKLVEERKIYPSETPGKVVAFDVRDEYLSFLKTYRGDYSRLKIGMDLSNGMAALLVKSVLEGENVSYICDTLDGTFPVHDPNPLNPESVKPLQALVKSEACDIGVIFDGDADRVMFTDENGRFISPDLMIGVLGHYFLEGKNMQAKVLQDIRTSKAVGEYLSSMGAEMQTWKVGRAFAARKLREIDGLFGGELAGHYYFRDFFYSDSGILACLIILNVVAAMKDKGVSVSRLIAGIEKYHNSGEINFRIENKAEAMEAVRRHFASKEKPDAEFDFDGYRLEFPDWWFNVRPSNTEPYLRFIVEANSPDMLKEKIEEAREIIMKYTYKR